MILYLHPENPEPRKLKQISDNLKKGKVYIFPTDTVYAIIADSNSREGVDQLYDLKKIPKNQPLSILCSDISVASEFVEQFTNSAFKLMKRITPGPYTFIFKSNKNVPRIAVSMQKEKYIGIRIPDNIYIQELLKIHEGTLTSTSVSVADEYVIDTDELETIYGNRVEAIIDGGIVSIETSTILDFTDEEMKIIREGKGMDKLS